MKPFNRCHRGRGHTVSATQLVNVRNCYAAERRAVSLRKLSFLLMWQNSAPTAAQLTASCAPWSWRVITDDSAVCVVRVKKPANTPTYIHIKRSWQQSQRRLRNWRYLSGFVLSPVSLMHLAVFAMLCWDYISLCRLRVWLFQYPNPFPSNRQLFQL